MRHRRMRRVFGAMIVGVLALGGIALASGRISYVTTRGVSMIPKYHTGDLVVLRKAGSYHVGEVAAYQSSLLHSIVLHRIVSEDNGLYTFKGDNNSFDDPISVPSSSIVGTDALDLPHRLAFVTLTPARLEILAFLIFLAGLVAIVEPHRRSSELLPRYLRARQARDNKDRTPWLVAGVVGVCVFGVLTGVALGVTGSLLSTQTLPYREKVTFSYSASTRPDTTYPTGLVTTGTPVFLNLVDSVRVRADFDLDAPSPVRAQGTVAITGTVQESDGWSHVLASSAPARFSGPRAEVVIDLPLRQALALARVAARETGVDQGAESVVVNPTIVLHGTVDGQPFKDSLSPRLTFQLSPLELSLLPGSDAGSAPTFPQLVSSQSGTVHRELIAPSEMSFIGIRIAGSTGVAVGILGLLASLAASLFGLTALWRRRDISDDERTLRRINREVVPISNDPSNSVQAVVEVATLAALAGLAERFEVGLLHYQEGPCHVYFAPIGEILYRCRMTPVERKRSYASDVVAVSAPARDREGGVESRPGARRRERPAKSYRPRRTRRPRLKLLSAQTDLETYPELLTYGAHESQAEPGSLRLDPLMSRLRPRMLSWHGPRGAHSASGRAKRAS